MNSPPKNRTSVARKVHIPNVEVSRCCSRSSNCSANAIWLSGILRLLFIREIAVRAADHHGSFVEIMFRRRRRGLPFEAGGVPGICRGPLPVLERPDEID